MRPLLHAPRTLRFFAALLCAAGFLGAGLWPVASVQAQQQDAADRAEERMAQLRQQQEAGMRERMEARRQALQEEIRRTVAPAAAAVLEQDSLALVALYNSTDGDNWENNNGWLEAPVADWVGVTVSGDRVIMLRLRFNNLTGEIPAELGQLTNLEKLDLPDNNLTGEVPVEISYLSNLEELSLSDNNLMGEIPAELSQLTNLEDLFLGGNNLTGEIPTELSQLANLEDLILEENGLTGSIPVAFKNLTAMSGVFLGRFLFDDTDLCEPPNPDFQAWLRNIHLVQSTGVICEASGGQNVEVVANVLDDARKIEVQGDLAYAGSMTALIILDVSDPADPIELGRASLPNRASDVEVDGSLAYVANGFAGLRIFDVSTPETPEEVGVFDAVNDVEDVEVAGSLAYVADDDAGLRIVDVSSPGSPEEIGAFTSLTTAEHVEVVSNLAYVATADGALVIVDVSTPENPEEVSFLYLPGSMEDINVVGSLAYTANNNGGLRIVDVSDPSAPEEIGSFSTTDAFHVDVSGDLAYLADGPDGGLRVIDVSDPSAPEEVGSYDTPGFAQNVKVSGGLAYLADGQNSGLYVLQYTGEGGSEGPAITSVSPNPVVGSNTDQPLTVSGSGFEEGAFVILDDLDDDQPPFENPAKTTFVSTTELVRKATFTPTTATWTAVVENPDGTQSEPFTFEVLAPEVVQYPSLALSTATLAPGESVTITGRSFTAGGSVPLRVTGPAGFETFTTTLTASADGTISTSFVSDVDAPAGAYAASAQDAVSGVGTGSYPFRVQVPPSNDLALNVTAPTAGQEKRAGTQVTVRWSDHMMPGDAYAERGSERVYRYDLELSTDGGATWISQGSRPGYHPIGETVRLSAVLQLPEDQTGTGLVRVTDFYQSERQAESGAFSILPSSSGNIESTLVWDRSFDRQPGNAPAGVAADGVARVYLKLKKKKAGGPPIAQVDVSVATASGNTDTRLTGTVMRATEMPRDGYSEEATGASSRTATSTSLGEDNAYWFWYVAPKDFVERSGDLDAASRTVKAGLTVTYADGTPQEQLTQEIEVVRPPLMLVHGIGGSASSWNELYYCEGCGSGGGRITLLRDSDRFASVRAVNLLPDASFEANSNGLLSDNFFSATGPSEVLRRVRMYRRYAASQVYFVGHSMGGSVARHLIGSGGTSLGGLPYHTRENYNQGYINRLITLNTPHLGSPFADFGVEEFIPTMIGQVFGLVSGPVDFLETFFKREDGEFVASDAVRDLRVEGGVSFPRTDVPSHLIASDLIPGRQGTSDFTVPLEVTDQFLSLRGSRFVYLMNIVWKVARRVTEGDVKDQLDALRFPFEVNPTARALKTFQILSGSSFSGSIGNLVSDGDVIVPVVSQLSGLPRGAANTSFFDDDGNPEGDNIGLTHFPLLPEPVLEATQVGNRVVELLNEPIESGKFDTSIPGTGAASANRPRFASNAQSLLQGLSAVNLAEAVNITAPQSGASIPTDSMLTLRFTLPDTTGLEDVQVFFQNETRLTTEQARAYDFSLPVSGSAVDSQAVTVLAFYERADSTALLSGQVTVHVEPSSPIQRLNVEPLAMTLREDEVRRPEYEAVFERSIARLGPGSDGLTASVEDASVVRFDPETKSFEGVSAGGTSATVSYRGQTDVLYFTVPDESGAEEEVLAGLQIAAGQTGTFDLGITGAEVVITENGDADGGRLRFARRDTIPPGSVFDGTSATAPDSSTITPDAVPGRYWTIISEDLTDVTFRVQLDTAGVEGINDPDRLLVLRREAAGEPWMPLNTTREEDMLISSALTSLGEFTLGGDAEDNPLPVELTAFDAATESGNVLLTWQTASEQGNSGFYVERKVGDAAQWTEIGFREGAGTTTAPQSYRFEDTGVPYEAERLTYRLRQEDLDGGVRYSDPVEITPGAPEAFALRGAFPNPFREQATIRYELPDAGPVRLSVYDVLGRRVAVLVDEEQTAGRKEVPFAAENLPSGTYFVRLEAGGRALTESMVLVR